jgi:lipoprotein-releasing system permease protein
MGYSFYVARRYFGTGRRSGFTTAITVISVMGVSLGVLALIVVLAVMNGFESEVIKRIIGTNAHVIVRNENGIPDVESTMQEIAGLPNVEAVAPFVFSKAMIMSRDGTDALFVKGIDPALEVEVTDFRDYVKPSHFSFEEGERGLGKIVVGKEIAYGLNLAIGDTVLLARAEVSEGVPFGISPAVERFIVGGFFDSGMYEYDASLGFLRLEDAQGFYGLGDRVTGLSVKLDDMYLAPEATALVSEVIGSGLLVTNWIRMNRNLFTWMKMEKKVMFLILTLIIVVAAWNTQVHGGDVEGDYAHLHDARRDGGYGGHCDRRDRRPHTGLLCGQVQADPASGRRLLRRDHTCPDGGARCAHRRRGGAAHKFRGHALPVVASLKTGACGGDPI